jgi:PKHD-type hydroxylase
LKLIRIAHLLDAPTLAALQQALADPALFVDGRSTAGWHARQVKRNLQARRGGVVDRALAQIEAALLAHEVFVAAARPKAIVRLLISRYEPGMTYGTHVDDALMGGVRTDLSFTLFLSDPESYQGGALVMDDAYGEREVKLPAGELILYPSTTLHRVEPVTTGVRLAAVGWVRSFVRDSSRREVLFDLETALRSVHDAAGKTPLFDLLAKTRTNLLRMWAED